MLHVVLVSRLQKGYSRTGRGARISGWWWWWWLDWCLNRQDWKKGTAFCWLMCSPGCSQKWSVGGSSFLNTTGPVKPTSTSFFWNQDDTQGQKYCLIVLEKEHLAVLHKLERLVHCCKLCKIRLFTSTVLVLTSLKYFPLSSVGHLRLQVFLANKNGQASHFAYTWYTLEFCFSNGFVTRCRSKRKPNFPCVLGTCSKQTFSVAVCRNAWQMHRLWCLK